MRTRGPGRNSNYVYLIKQLSILEDDLSLPWNTYPCLEWPFFLDKKGYGRMYHDGMKLVHRVSFSIANPSFDNKLDVLHRCDNPPCFRPSHLFDGTNADNIRDAIRKGIFHGGSPQIGSENGNSKLKERQVVEIKRMLTYGIGPKQIAGLYGVHRRTIQAIRLGETWRGV